MMSNALRIGMLMAIAVNISVAGHEIVKAINHASAMATCIELAKLKVDPPSMRKWGCPV